MTRPDEIREAVDVERIGRQQLRFGRMDASGVWHYEPLPLEPGDLEEAGR